MRLLYVLRKFRLTTSETMCNYYLQTWYKGVAARVAERIKTYYRRKLGNIRKVSKLYRMIG